MDYFAVSRGGLATDRVGGFKDHDLPPGLRNRSRDREADYPGTGDDNVGMVLR